MGEKIWTSSLPFSLQFYCFNISSFSPLSFAFSLSLLISKVEQRLPITSPKKGSKRASVTQMEEAGDNVWRAAFSLTPPRGACVLVGVGHEGALTLSILLPVGFSRGGVQIGAACVSGDIRSMFRKMRIWYDRLQRRATAYTLRTTCTDTDTL